MNKFLFVLIGNRNLERNLYVIPKISSFLTLINVHNNFLRIEWQASFFRLSFFYIFILSIYYSILEFRWRRYFSTISLLFSLKLLFGIFRFKNKSEVFATRQLTSKHIRAWESFIDSDSNFLVIMEDDVIFKDNSADRFRELVLECLFSVSTNQKNYIYFDLAGGFDLNKLNLSEFIIKKDQVINLLRPTTNTTCSYLISRDLVEKFLNIIYKKPHLRNIAIDWLINLLFLTLKNEKITCIHFEPSIFIHGSIDGFYESLI